MMPSMGSSRWSRSTRARAVPFVRAACVTLLGLLGATPAHAWDPATTHLQLTDRAVLDSDVHARWMEGSGDTLGLFSRLRVDPALLTPQERRIFAQAIEAAPAEAGTRPLGGPGACPLPGAPLETQRYCVEDDLWQLDAIGWVRFGVIAESSPPTRLRHHFRSADPASPLAWTDTSNAAAATTRTHLRSNRSKPTARFLGTDAPQGGRTARDWSRDPLDPLALPRLNDHLEGAATASSQRAREHHLAMALVCLGALLHVAQDLAVPAHARADVSAFFTQLSARPGDRGLPLQEWARRQQSARTLPLTLAPRVAPGASSAGDLDALLFGEDGGLGSHTARHHFSPGTLPAPRKIAEELAPDEAAAALLANATIAAAEQRGATLTGWPGASGYLLSGTGRVLSAWRRTPRGDVQTFLDEDVYRSQATILLPAAVQASTAIVQRVFPVWPAQDDRIEQGILTFTLPTDLADVTVQISTEDLEGHRGPTQTLSVSPGVPLRLVGIPVPSAERNTVITFLGLRADGVSYVTTRVFEAPARAGSVGEGSEAGATSTQP